MNMREVKPAHTNNVTKILYPVTNLGLGLAHLITAPPSPVPRITDVRLVTPAGLEVTGGTSEGEYFVG